MGKPKFTVEDGKRIMDFIKKWRRKNPNAVEWPLADIQEKLQMSKYTRDQIRNKIATLQKSEKMKGSPHYKTLNLRQSMALKYQRKSRSRPNSGEDEECFRKTLCRKRKIDVVTKMFLDVDPAEAFNGWFQMKVHTKAAFGETIAETWDVVAENWEEIRSGLPMELQQKLMESAQGTKYLSLFGTSKTQAQQKSSALASVNAKTDTESSSNSSSSDESIQPIDSDLSNNESDLDMTPSMTSSAVDFVPIDSNQTSVIDDQFTKLPYKKSQIPFKYMVQNGWTIPKSKELEPTCSYFGLEANSNIVAAKSETNWAVIIPIMLSYPNIWPKITDTGVWKEILKQGKFIRDPVSTKFEFFRDILPKRDTYFDMENVTMNMLLNLEQKEALNLVFYSIFQGESFADFQRLFDDGLLSNDSKWYEWIFVLKEKLDQTEADEFFKSNGTGRMLVNNRLYSLIFNDGMAMVYKTERGQQVIEKLIRTIYASKFQN